MDTKNEDLKLNRRFTVGILIIIGRSSITEHMVTGS